MDSELCVSLVAMLVTPITTLFGDSLELLHRVVKKRVLMIDGWRPQWLQAVVPSRDNNQ